jgi:hypothetical protein
MSPTRRAYARSITRTILTALTVAVIAVPSPASAATGSHVEAVKSLPEVVAGLQHWIMGILFAIATLYAVIACVYYTTAGGDPAQVEKAKTAGRNALTGYAMAVLAPVAVAAVRGIVGG